MLRFLIGFILTALAFMVFVAVAELFGVVGLWMFILAILGGLVAVVWQP